MDSDGREKFLEHPKMAQHENGFHLWGSSTDLNSWNCIVWLNSFHLNVCIRVSPTDFIYWVNKCFPSLKSYQLQKYC